MLARTDVLVALDATSIQGARTRRSLLGLRLDGYVRQPLPQGALAPSPLEKNLVDRSAVVEALGMTRTALGVNSRRVVIVLPEGVARPLVLEMSGHGFDEGMTRFRLAAMMACPQQELAVHALRVDRRRFLVAAVRNDLLAEYSQAAREAGLDVERIELAPLAAIAGLMREPRGPQPTVDVMLGDAALTLAAWDQGGLRVLRARRREPGPQEAEELAVEVDRTAAWIGSTSAPRLRILGSRAQETIAAMMQRGRVAGPGLRLAAGGPVSQPNELSFLGASLITGGSAVNGRPRSTPKVLARSLLGVAMVVLVLEAWQVWAALAGVGQARAAAESQRRSLAAAEQRLSRYQGLDARGEKLSSQLDLVAAWPPPRVLGVLEGLLPAGVRLDGFSITYGSSILVEFKVVARQAQAYDAFVQRLDQTGTLQDVVLGSENRDGPVVTSVKGALRVGSAR